jgi:hypothetical protein
VTSRICKGLLAGVLAYLAFHSMVAGWAQGPTPAAWKEAIFPAVFTPSGRSFPRMSNGYFVALPRTLAINRASATIAVTPSSGGQGLLVPFSLNAASSVASKVRLEDAAVAPSGSLVLAGSYGRPDGPVTVTQGFLTVIDLNGAVKSTIPTGDFTPERVCASSDGTFWTLGQEEVKEGRQNLKYNMLQHYSIAGTMIGSYLPRSSLHAVRLPMNLHFHEATASVAFLACGPQSVGAYIGTAATWFEVALPSGNTVQWPITRPSADQLITGIALLGTHAVYATVGSLTPSAHAEHGLYQLFYDTPAARAKWQPVSYSTAAVPGNPSNDVRLSGTDNGSLVVVAGRPAAGKVLWIKP